MLFSKYNEKNTSPNDVFFTLIDVAKAQPLARTGQCGSLPLVTRRRRKPQPVMSLWSGGGGAAGITTPAPTRPYTRQHFTAHQRDSDLCASVAVPRPDTGSNLHDHNGMQRNCY